MDPDEIRKKTMCQSPSPSVGEIITLLVNLLIYCRYADPIFNIGSYKLLGMEITITSGIINKYK